MAYVAVMAGLARGFLWRKASCISDPMDSSSAEGEGFTWTNKCFTFNLIQCIFREFWWFRSVTGSIWSVPFTYQGFQMWSPLCRLSNQETPPGQAERKHHQTKKRTHTKWPNDPPNHQTHTKPIRTIKILATNPPKSNKKQQKSHKKSHFQHQVSSKSLLSATRMALGLSAGTICPASSILVRCPRLKVLAIKEICIHVTFAVFFRGL